MLTNLSQQMSRLDCRKATGHKYIRHVRFKYYSRSGRAEANIYYSLLYYTVYYTYTQSKTTTQAKHDTEIKRII